MVIDNQQSSPKITHMSHHMSQEYMFTRQFDRFSSEAGEPVATTVGTIAIGSENRYRIILAILRTPQVCDWVRIRITEMVPGMLEIGSNLIEALNLYEIHQDFIDKIENRHDEIREVLRKADTMVESTDASQSQVYQAMAISLKDAWKELMMRMEERKILLELVIAFFRNCEEFGQHMDYAYSVCQSTLIADSIEQVQVLIEEHQDIKKKTMEHSMNTIQSSQGLLDKLIDIGRNLENEGANAVSRSGNIESILTQLHDRRTLLEELWLQRKIRLEQSLLIFQLDVEIQQITNWFLTVGSDNMHHTDLGNNPTETDKLIQVHAEFIDNARVIETRIIRVLRSVDTLILTGHEDGDNIRERVSEIESLNKDIVKKIEDRRKRLTLTLEFWASASMAFDRLAEIEHQIEETINVPETPSLGSNWKSERLAKLAQAILESTTPAIREGCIILDGSKSGADGVKYIVEKLKERCGTLGSVCSEIRSDRSSLFMMYDDKYSVITTWLVNIGQDLLNKRRILGCTLQAASDFLDDHSRLNEDLKSRFIDVESCTSAVQSMELNQEAEAPEARAKVEELKTRWRTLMTFTEQRIHLAQTYLDFLNQSDEMVKLMDTLEELLKLENWNLDSRTLESTRRIWLEKFRIMNELYEMVYYKGRCFLKDSKTQTLNDKQLSVEATVEYTQQQLEVFEERRRIINDLWDTWKLKMPFIRGDISSQWDMYSNDSKKSLNWIIEIQKKLFAPLVIGDPKHCRQTAYVMKDRLAEIKITYKRVTSEVERWLKMGEMLNIKQKPESSDKDGEDKIKTQVMEEVLKIPQKLINEHKSFQKNMQIYDMHITVLVKFLFTLADLYDTIDATYSEVEKAKHTQDPEFVIKVLKVLDSTKVREEKLFKETLQTGNNVIKEIDEKNEQPARKETKVILNDLELDHQHWINWYHDCGEELQSKIQSATHSNRTIYILQCIDQFQNELFDMEGAYGEGTESLLEIVKNFELWLQDLQGFENKEFDPFIETITKCVPPETHNAERCNAKWAELQKSIKRHRSLLELAREYHVILDELESLSMDIREQVIDISRRTVDSKSPEENNSLKKELDGCSKRVEKLFKSKLDRVYELAKKLFDPPPKYLDNLKSRKDEIKDSIDTVMDELDAKLGTSDKKREPDYDEIVDVIQIGPTHQLSSAPTKFPTLPAKTPPKITGLQDLTVENEERAAFECAVIGTTPIKVIWQKDGKRLIDSSANKISSNGNKYSLIFPKTSKDDSGTITIIAENEVGKTNSSAYLHVQGPLGEAPSIVKLPKSLPKMSEGSTVKMECTVSGTPTPEVVWYRNGREITPNDHFNVRASPEGHHSLTIPDCILDDSGDYSISAINDCGDVTKTCKVTITSAAKPPKFLTQLKDNKIDDGKPLRWTVEVEGCPTPVVKWFRENEDMSKFDCEIEHVGNTCTLILDEVFPDDDGKYTVVATNEHGTAKSTASLAVTVVGEPPKFVKKPKDITVDEGKSAEFSCKVTGTPTPEIKWLNKDGEEIVESSDFNLSHNNGTSKLLIKEVAGDDEGKLLCKAVNKVGEATASVFLTIKKKSKPFFEVPIKDVNCREFDSATFQCVLSGDPKPTVEWFHNGEPIDPDNKELKITSSGNKHTLDIKEAKYGDRGTYKAVASNSEGEEGCSAFLDVEEIPFHLKPHPPQIETPMAVQLHASEGDPVTIECEISGNPKPDITWYKDRKHRIKPGPDLKLTHDGSTYGLHIQNCITEDSGSYTLYAKNKHGEISACCNVYVREKQMEPEPPEFVIGLREVSAREGESATFECVVKGTPMPTVFWFLNGEKLTDAPDQQIRRNDDKHLLKLHKLEIEDTGPITATASNVSGTVSSTAPLVVVAKEKKPILIQPLASVKSKIGEDVIMECKIGHASNRCTICLYKDDLLVPEDNEHVQLFDDGEDSLRIQIKQITAQDEGQYCIEVLNGAGAVTTSAFCQIIVPNKYGSTRSVHKTEETVIKHTKMELLHSAAETEAPVFISDILQPPIAEMGQDVILEMIVKGNPTPEVKWLKDNEPVNPKRCAVTQDDGKCTLIIRKVTAKDEGEYSIVATNKAGKAQCTCQLLVDDTSNAPTFTERLTTQEVEEGQPLELHATVRGNPEPTVRWYLNDHQFKPSSGDNIFQEGPRHGCFIKKVTPDHQGKISVIAENERGKATSSAEIIVTDPAAVPLFLKELHDLKLSEGETVELIVELNSDCDVSWMRDNQPLKVSSDKNPRLDIKSRPNNKHFLTLKNGKTSDSGIYSVKAVSKNNRNTVAVNSCNVVIKAIKEAPLIRRKLKDVVVGAGEEVKLEIEVSGSPEPEVTWFRDGARIISSKDFHLSQKGNRHILTIPEVFPEDHGTFKVVVKNAVGQDSSSAVLKIKEDEEEIIDVDYTDNILLQSQPKKMTMAMPAEQIFISKHMEPVAVQEGSPAALQCELSGPHNDNVVVSWSKDGICVDNDPNYSFSYNNSVARCFISECFPEDSGTWTCSFNYPNTDPNEAIASSTTLTCNEVVEMSAPRSQEGLSPDSNAPQFLQSLSPQRSVEGGHALFQCIVAGFPHPDVQWLKNGEVVQSGYRYQIQNDVQSGHCSLSISFILPDEDAGVYSCVATNVKGQAVTESALLDDEGYKKYLAEQQKAMFIGELSQKVKERSPAVHRKDLKKSTYRPRYELTLVKNTHRRFDMSPDSGVESYFAGNGGPNYHSSLNRPKKTQTFSPTAFEDRLMNEIEFSDEKLRNSYPSNEPGGDDDDYDAGLNEHEMERPSFHSRPKDQKLIESSTVQFEYLLRGNPAPKVNWFHNGRPLYPSQRMNIRRFPRDPNTGLSKAVLTLATVFDDDAGHYTVLAWNPKGRLAGSTQIYVDKVGAAPEDQVDANKMRALQMLEERNKKVEEPVKPGVYEKHLAPCFIMKPQDVYVKEGKTARFDCKVAGRPTPTLTWYQDGRVIHIGDTNRVSVVREDGTNSLLFQAVKVRDMGQYECVATNKGGEARFKVRLIVDETTVEEAPQIIDKPRHPVNADEYDPVILRVQVTGFPEPELTCQKDGVKKDPYNEAYDTGINSRPRVERISPGVHEISFPGGARKDDSGWYTCLAKNPAGCDSFSCKINVKSNEPVQPEKPNPVKISIPKRQGGPRIPPPSTQVELKPPSYVKPDEWNDNELWANSKCHEPPRFKKLLKDVAVDEGNKTYMECTVYPAGDPTMVVEWFKDGRPIFHATRFRPIFEFGFCVLEFDDVWARDSGVYTCRAVNKVGQDEVSCRVNVRATKGSVVEDSQLPIEMRAGFEQLNQWEQLRANIPMTLHAADDDAELGPPIIVQYPEQVEVLEGTAAKFLCRVSGNPVPNVFWYRNEQLLSSSNRINISFDGIHRLEISKCRPSDTGAICMIARNQYGEARFDTVLIVKKKSADSMNRNAAAIKTTETTVMKKFVSNNTTTTTVTNSNGYN